MRLNHVGCVTACRAGAVAKLRIQDFQHDGEQYVLRFQENGGISRDIPVRLELQRDVLAYLSAAGIGADVSDRPLFRSTVRKTKQLSGECGRDRDRMVAVTNLIMPRSAFSPGSVMIRVP